jgi:catechol 2,3-dioxygenase-like lactoylglutathione lyase family enzyme
MKLISLLVATAALFPAAGLAETAAAPAPAAVGIMGVGLNVTDVEKSLKFYRDGIGMTVLGGYDLPNAHETFLTFGQAPGAMVILVSGPGVAAAAASHHVNFGRIVVQANDVAAIQSRLKAAGQATGELHSTAGRQVMIVTDPDGYRVEFVGNPATKP